MNIEIKSFDHYQELASKTALPNVDLTYLILKLTGEIGEMNAAMIEFFSLGDTEENTLKLIDECGDVLWYASQIRRVSGSMVRIDLDGFEELTTVLNTSFMAAARMSEEMGKALRHGWKRGDLPGIHLSEEIHRSLPEIYDAVSTVLYFANSTASECMSKNIRKVFDRAARGVTKGRGDVR